jgi:hypothetical protein
MKYFDWKKLLPHIFAIGIFLIVAVFYCKPALQGKVLQQSDVGQWKAMSKDAFNYRDKHEVFPLWINNMFSGMPSFQVAAEYNNKLPYIFINIFSLWLPKPINFFFLACVCFYFLAQALRINRVISILGGLAFAYATYNPVIMVAGHDTKMLSIALMPALIGSLILLYERNYRFGTALTAVTASTLFAANHPQIAYYTGLIAAALTIGYIVNWVKEKQYKHLMVAGSLAAFAVLTGLLVNASILFTTYDFAKATIRGGNALSKDTGDKASGGLSTDYALSYSLYKTEPLVLLFPTLYGGSSAKDERGEDSKAVEALSAMPQELQSKLQNSVSYYWGGIKGVGTAGPPYIGSIICFFALTGMFILDNKHKWWIAGITVAAIMMSWGEYFLTLNEPLLKILPFYNKFRAPSMIMVIPQLVLTILACLLLNHLIENNLPADKNLFNKKFKNGLIAFGVLIGLTLVLYFSSDFYNFQDKELLKQVKDLQPQVKEPVMSFFTALKEDRQALMLNSIVRSIIFIGIAIGLIYFYKKGIIKQLLLTILLTLTVFIDVITVDTKYFNSENFLDAEEDQAAFTPTPADQQILQDKTFYRVFNTTVSPFSDTKQSYYHNSIGGYNPAKLSIYQDLIEYQLSKSPANMPVFNMLNTKYFISGNPSSPQVLPNPGALGNAWFVKAVKLVTTPLEEMNALTDFHPKDTAVANKEYASAVKYVNNAPDSSANIRLIKNDNDYIQYESNNNHNGFGVFSEVFYDKGWLAYIDNKETPIAKVNYVLRGLSIPSGKHNIEFKFEPKVYKLGSMITSIFTIVLLLIILAAIFMEYKEQRKATKVTA